MTGKPPGWLQEAGGFPQETGQVGEIHDEMLCPDEIGKMGRQGQGIGLGRQKVNPLRFLLLSTHEAGEMNRRLEPSQGKIEADDSAGKFRLQEASRSADAAADVNDAGMRLNSGAAGQHAGRVDTAGMRLVVRIEVLRADPL